MAVLLCLMLTIGIYYYFQKDKCLALWHDLRWLRVLHYYLTLCLGIALAFQRTSPRLTPSLFLQEVMFACVSILFAALFCIIENNIADVAIDTLSNPHRPLVKGLFTVPEYKRIGFAAFIGAIVFSLLISPLFMCGLLLIMAIYHFYSVPPLRFKRLIMLSKLSISLNSLIILSLGYFLYAHSLDELPLILIPIYLLGATLAANMIDIKDVLGDKALGIKTTPNTLGLPISIGIITLGFLLAYLGFYFLQRHTNIYLLLFLIALSGCQGALLFHKPYEEKIFLLFYLLWLTLGVLYLLIS